MAFRKCSIGGKVYNGEILEDDTEDDTITLNENGKSTPTLVNAKASPQSNIPKGSSSKNNKKKKKEKQEKKEKKPFTDNDLLQDMKTADPGHKKAVNDFFTLLAICHTVLVSTTDGEQQYKAQSPDEAALVQAAKDMGYTFRSRESDNIIITKPDGKEVHFELLNILEFTSSRKRMSIIVRSPDDGRITLYCKGADNVIFERLRCGQDFSLNITGEHLEEFAKEGTRNFILNFLFLLLSDP
jgi:phospholipid-translocating ATPase